MSDNNDEKVIFGEINFRNQRTRFGIKTDDRRRHMYVVGKTGMGKTEILKNMAVQDIQAGRGVAFVDPHGDTADALLDYIPKERIKDVVYFDPADMSFPIAFNVMENINDEQRHLLASGLLGVFKKIFPDVWSARMEYILNNTILALLEFPGATLLGINHMLANKGYREAVLEKVTDPIVKSFWTQEFARYTDRLAVEATAAVQNKIGQFTSSTVIRNIIGQVKSTIDTREVMDKGKILIINISRGKIGEDASRLLGALLVTKMQLAAMSRVDVPEEKRKDFYLYVDEFQHFATESFANILSEARKYRLSLVMAHQYITQMDEKVRDAVFGNVGTIITFRIGAEDAELLEKEFAPEFSANDIVNLAKWKIYLKLMIDGVASRPFSADTLSPFPKLTRDYRQEILEHSRETYAFPREEVEKEINKWAASYEKTSAAAPRYPERAGGGGMRKPFFSSPGSSRPPSFSPHPTERPRSFGQTRPFSQPPADVPRNTPSDSLREALSEEPKHDFREKKIGPKMTEKAETPRSRTQVDLDALRKTLQAALKKNEDEDIKEQPEQNRDAG